MKIVIHYSSKWSAELSHPVTKENIVNSGKVLKDDNRKIITMNDSDDYETLMFKSADRYRNFRYKTITKSTVIGIMSRLMGETRYVSNIIDIPDHPVAKIVDKISFTLHERVLYNEVINIHKPPTGVQNNGGGFIRDENANFLLLSKNKVSQVFFSIFKMNDLNTIHGFVNFVINNPSYDELVQYLEQRGLFFKGDVNITSFLTLDSIHREGLYDTYLSKYVKYLAHKFELSETDPEESNFYETYDEILNIISDYTKMNLAEDGNFAFFTVNPKDESKKVASPQLTGLLYYFLAQYFEDNGFSDEVTNSLLNKNRNIAGIATNSGAMTIKDFLGRISPKKVSYTMPYMIDANFQKVSQKDPEKTNPQTYTLGMGKEGGILEININIPEEDARELKERIECCGVSTFTVGKKGLAYVKEMNIYE